MRCGRFSEGIHLHHKTPLGDGGTNDFSNLVPLCVVCHVEWHNIEHFISFDELMELPNGLEIAALFSKNPNIIVGDQQISLKELIRTTRGHIKDYFNSI